jgi:DNA modification methylase
MTDPKITETDLTDFVPDSHNANRGTERGQKMIEDSLAQDGAARSIVVDKDNRIVAGNKTLEAAVSIGLEKAIVVETEGNELVVVRRKNWDLSADESPRRYAYRDNRASEVSLSWDPEVILADIEAGVELGAMFGDDELKDILGELRETEKEEGPPAVDRAEELRELWGVELGDLWRVGEHRVICGDCTDRGVVERVMGGDRADLGVTDPPYGVNYDPEWRARYDEHFGHLKGNKLKSYREVSNDDNFSWSKAFELFAGNTWYVWHADRHAIHTAIDLIDAGFELRTQIIWRKPNFVISRGHYHYQHEPCWYAVRKVASANWQGDRTQSTVWDIASLQPMGRSQDELDERTGHGTQKPIECMSRPIRNNSKEGDLIYDPVLGSGTTLIAAHSLNRKAIGIEIDPAYVAVTLQRAKDYDIAPIERIEAP